MRGLVERYPCPTDGRATKVTLTDVGWATVRAAAPGHVATVREHVIDPLTARQVTQLTELTHAMLSRLDPAGAMRPVDQLERT